jgi:hypothetical protein
VTRSVICAHGIAELRCRDCTAVGTVNDFVDAHPEGADLEEVAEALGISKQGVLRIERHAMGRIRREPGPTFAVFRAVVKELAA